MGAGDQLWLHGQRAPAQEGFDAVFVPKGYDEQLLADQGRERDIELAFVGSVNSVAYSGRKALLDELGQVENLLVTRTKSGEDYCNTLNRIRFFVSATSAWANT